jgi:hypothetical protein
MSKETNLLVSQLHSDILNDYVWLSFYNQCFVTMTDLRNDLFSFYRGGRAIAKRNDASH